VPRLRADAARNRQAILDAARAVYGQHGLDAPLDDIARAAGLGNATLYRHFPSRCELIAAVFAETLQRVIAAGDVALRADDAWNGFCEHVRQLCAMQAADRGLADLLITRVSGAPQLERLRARAYRNLVRLADRANHAGGLRSDFTPEDLALLLMANAGLVQRADASACAASRRFIDLALDGLRAPAATPASPPPPPDAVRRAMSSERTTSGSAEPLAQPVELLLTGCPEGHVRVADEARSCNQRPVSTEQITAVPRASWMCKGRTDQVSLGRTKRA
jgi:AcrR family transcriptional regulator